MPSIKKYCVLPTCEVRIRNGWRGRRIESNHWRLRVTSVRYLSLRDHVGYDFLFEEDDCVCDACDIKVRSGCRVKVESDWKHVKRPRHDDEPNAEGFNSQDGGRDSIMNSEHDASPNHSPLYEVSHDTEISVSITSGSVVTDESLKSHVPTESSDGLTETEQSNACTERSDACTETENPYPRRVNSGMFIVPRMSSLIATQRKCCICGGKGRSRIPLTAVIDAWMSKRIYIPPKNRCCKHHVENGKLVSGVELKPQKKNAEISGPQLTKLMHGIATYFAKNKRTLDFDGVNYDDGVYDMLLGVTKPNFEILYMEACKGMRNSKNRTTRNAVAMFLMKLRLNVSQRVIAFLFDCKHQSTVSEAIKAVLERLETSFVNKHIGYEHKTREQFMTDHSKQFFTKVLGLEPGQMIIILDGTYLYIEKSSDFKFQRQTFSLHKFRNLLKPMMIVFPDGYILEAEGLYLADGGKNDAKILKHMLKKKGSNIAKVLRKDDALLLDRGFRDIQKELEDKGYKVYMPACVQKRKKSEESKTQFTTAEANKSRQVTMLRRVVEQANGRIKNKFPFFEDTIRASYFKKLGRLFRVAVAIINAFSPPLFTEKPFNDKVAEIVATHIDEENELMTKVISENWRQKRVSWENATEDSCLGFPSMTEEQLMELTLGSYQLAMGLRYNEQHFSNTGSYSFQVHKEQLGVIRVKMPSRFSKSTVHYVWIQYSEYVNGREGISGWYCDCKTGSRTLGCCSHVAGVVRFLSMDRFEERSVKEEVSSYFMDAAAALADFEDGSEEDEESGDDVTSEEEDEESDEDVNGSEEDGESDGDVNKGDEEEELLDV